MSESFVLKAEVRENLGSRASRKLRAEGRIPASIPTDGEHDHLNFHIDEREFLATRRHHVHLYDIDVSGSVESALVRELQWNSMGDRINHIEFKRVQRGVETETDVPIEIIGQPKGGQLNVVHGEIRIRVLPSKIPDAIEIRVGELDVGSHLKAGDLDLPEAVSLAVPEDLEILVVSAERVAAVEEPAEMEEGEPEVIDEKKPEEGTPEEQ
jgi:large subunit ribosomal protein L25